MGLILPAVVFAAGLYFLLNGLSILF